MRAFRLIACAALALPASACTIWYLADDPYRGDAGADADVKTDAMGDGPAPAMFERIGGGVGSIAAYGDVLYANINGTLESCTDQSGCASLGVLVGASASTIDPPGLAADDAGVFWVEGDGIWAASLDGSAPDRVVVDPNNPQVLALDGERLSWTTQSKTGPVIHTCQNPRAFCGFPGNTEGGAPKDAGFTGNGAPLQLVASDAGIANQYLAAGSGYVLWVVGDGSLVFTPVDGGASTPINPTNTPLANAATKTFVSNDDRGNVFAALFGNSRFVILQSAYPSTPTFPTSPTNVLTNINASYCLNAVDGLVGYSIGKNRVIVSAEDGAAPTYFDMTGDAGVCQTFAATTHWYFVLDANSGLYRYPRAN